MVTRKSETLYADAISIAQKLHKNAQVIRFDPSDLERVKPSLQRIQPRYALVFVEPAQLDVNFAWQLLKVLSEIDDDPFVDVRYGFVTGDTPRSAADLMRRTMEIVSGQADSVRRRQSRFVDVLGPITGSKDGFFESKGSFILPVFEGSYESYSINHGESGFPGAKLRQAFAQSGIVHFGGHGSPAGVDNGLKSKQLNGLPLADYSVISSGACYTGVVDSWFELWDNQGVTVKRHTVPEESFCLSVLKNPVVAYFGALHADHGIPVYQELEYLAYTGGTTGDAIKHTYDGIVAANNGVSLDVPTLEDGASSPRWSPSRTMLLGSASRVLFGDPSICPGEAFADPPLKTSVVNIPGGIRLTVSPLNLKLKSSFTDTYFSDIAAKPDMFNDRALIRIPLPPGVHRLSVKKVDAQIDGTPLKTKLRGCAIEQEEGKKSLFLQIDLPAEGFMASKWRQPSALLRVELASR